MNAMVIYDSVFGNTERIARAIGSALGKGTPVQNISAGHPGRPQLCGDSLRRFAHARLQATPPSPISSPRSPPARSLACALPRSTPAFPSIPSRTPFPPDRQSGRIR